MSNWLATSLQVAEIATNVLRQLVKAPPGAHQDEGPYTTGTVQWYYDASGHQLHAYNNGSEEAALTYAKAITLQGGAHGGIAEVVPLPAHHNRDVTVQQRDFFQGQVAVAPVVPFGPFGPPPQAGANRMVTFTINALVLGVTARILTGVDLSVGRNAQTGYYRVTISTPKAPFHAAVKATDFRGNAVTASASLGTGVSVNAGVSLNGAQTLVIELPAGVDLSPVVQNLSAEITMPIAAYEQAVAERRALATPGLPAFLMEPAAAR
jgi:hypothetical protein